MRQLFQFCCLGIAAAGLLLAPARTAVAQTAGDPAVVIAMGSIDNQLADIKFLMEGAGQGAQFGMIQMMSAQFLKGLDRKRQIGGMLWFNEDNPEPKWLALVPVTNIDDVIDLVAQQMDVEEDGDTYIINTPADERIYVREASGYAAISAEKSLLGMVPSTAGEMIASVPADYMAGARVYVQRIPEGLREMIISQIESGYREQLEQLDDEDLADLQRANVDMQLARIRSMINETEDLFFGLNVDQEARSVHLDMQMTGQSGSELARQSENYAGAGPTRFGSLLRDDATMMMGMTARISPEDAAEGVRMLDGFRKTAMSKLDEEEEMSEGDRRLIENILDSALDVVRETFEAGKMDAAAMGNVLSSGTNMIAGVQAINPARLENAIKEAVSRAREEAADKAEFRLDMETVSGVRLHEIVVDIGDNEEAASLFGNEKLKVYLGVGSDVVYLALGNDPLDLLKQTISGGGQTAESMPMQFSMHLAPFLAKLAEIQDEEMQRKMADALSASGRDRIRFLMKAIPRGFDIRFEAEDGILRMIGVAVQNMGGMMGPGADF